MMVAEELDARFVSMWTTPALRIARPELLFNQITRLWLEPRWRVAV
jgi:hypothetical protein